MIGNLFNAIAISLMSGVFAIGGVRANDHKPIDINNTMTNYGDYTGVDGMTYTSYGQINVSFPANDNNFRYYQYNFTTQTLTNSTHSGYNYMWSYEDASDIIADIGANQTDFFYCYTTKFNSSSNARVMRMCVPFRSVIDCLSFSIVPSDASAIKMGFATTSFANMTEIESTYHSKPVTIMLHDTRSMYTNAPNSPTLTYNDESVFKFIEYTFSWPSNKLVIMNITFLNGSGYQYQNGYSVGYNDGYNTGLNTGYSNGYSEALEQIGSNATFMGLFNAIADTPLRFIYGLFNFDLFGISMLTIILSLLTGIVTFGIVRKVWK